MTPVMRFPRASPPPDGPMPLCRKCNMRPVPLHWFLRLCDDCLWELAEHYGTTK